MTRSPRFALMRQLASGPDALTRAEIRYLRLFLPAYSPDFIAELPLEIVILIVAELSLKDFARCFRVSKAWREKLLSHPVMVASAKQRWPALNCGTIDASRFIKVLSRVGYMLYFYAARSPRFACECDRVPYDGRQTAHITQYQLDPAFHDWPDSLPADYTRHHTTNNLVTSPLLYSSGKAAWHLCSCVVVVDDVKAKTRKVLTPPSGIMYGSTLKLQALGSRLVVASTYRMIIAWDHVHNQAYEKTLPSPILGCATHEDIVAIMLHRRDVVIWTAGQAVLQLEVPSLTRQPSPPFSTSAGGACEGIFFNTHEERTLYLVSAFCFRVEEALMTSITVNEFSAAGHKVTWTFECPARDERYSQYPLTLRISEHEFDRSCIVFWQKREGSDGGYLLASFDKIERKFTSFVHRVWEWSCGDDETNSRLLLLRASTYAKQGLDLDFVVCSEVGEPHYEIVWFNRQVKPA